MNSLSKLVAYTHELKKKTSLYFLPSHKYFQQEGLVWGTSYNIIYESRKELGKEILETIKMIDGSLSIFNPHSIISRINRNETMKVDHHFQYMFQTCQLISYLTDGLYDPTIKPLIDLWTQQTLQSNIPSIQQIQNVQKLIGINECSVSNKSIKKKHDATQFDFSSLAKGYGVDCVASLFNKYHIKNYMVEIGGECFAHGVNPYKSAWKIRLDVPSEYISYATSALSFELSDLAMATAGNYRSFFPSAQGHIGHILNPISGYPIKTNLISATVFAENCVTADALSTACFLTGTETLNKIKDKFPTTKIIILESEDGKGNNDTNDLLKIYEW